MLNAGPRNCFTAQGLLVHNCWLDHSGNYLKFRDRWDELYENGVTELSNEEKKPQNDLTDKEIDERRCPSCSSLWPSKSDTCPVCGHVKLRLNLVEQVEGELVELKAGADRATKQLWWGQILTWGATKNWSRGACSHRYRERFGVWPVGLQDTPLPINKEVHGWLHSRQIAWARSKAKGMR